MERNKITNYFSDLWEDFYDWFGDKEHPRSRLNRTIFFHDILKFVGLLLVFLIIYSNVDKFNNIKLIFIKLGSLLLLVTLFFLIRTFWHLIKNLKYWFRGLNNGIKMIIWIGIVLLILWAFMNQELVVNSITNSYEETNFSKLNPISLNVSLEDLSFGSSIQKPYIKCSENLTDCKKSMYNCEGAILFEESSMMDLEITITKKSDYCKYYYYVKNSFVEQLDGNTMTCELPLDKLGKRPDSIENIKYCEGSLKTNTMGMLTTFFMGW